MFSLTPSFVIAPGAIVRSGGVGRGGVARKKTVVGVRPHGAASKGHAILNDCTVSSTVISTISSMVNYFPEAYDAVLVLSLFSLPTATRFTQETGEQVGVLDCLLSKQRRRRRRPLPTIIPIGKALLLPCLWFSEVGIRLDSMRKPASILTSSV